MARTVNPEEHAAKRNQILDVALRLVFTKGYERMTIQDILNELGMSSGAFYHYFRTKPAVLEALIERIQQDVEAPLLFIVNDPHLTALDKLQGFFATLEKSSMSHNPFIADLLHVWFADDNTIVREKVYEAMRERRAPLLTLIVRQGIEEEVFTTPYPDQAGEVILSLARGMSDTVARLMLALQQEKDQRLIVDEIVATYAAYSGALERVLSAPSGSLQRLTNEAAAKWTSKLRDG